eukprot:68052-Rhodomonas_salina.2
MTENTCIQPYRSTIPGSVPDIALKSELDIALQTYTANSNTRNRIPGTIGTENAQHALAHYRASRSNGVAPYSTAVTYHVLWQHKLDQCGTSHSSTAYAMLVPRIA